MPSPLVISVVLNTNHREDTLGCLASLAANTYPNHKVIVLDNASTDGSVAAVKSAFPEVQVIELKENLGYAGNNNVGIAAAVQQGADWIYVLNEDTTQAADSIAELVAAGEADAAVGIVGPMVYHADEPDVIQSAGGKMDRYFHRWHVGQNENDHGQYAEIRSVDWISGCGLLIRRAVVEQIGMIDARFFYYNEEVEWCVRAREAGWKIWLVPQAKLWHKGVQRNYQPKPSVTYYATRNQLLTLRLHHASFAAWCVNYFDIFRSIISWTVKPRWKEMRVHRDASWRGVVDFWSQKWGKMR